MGIKNYLEKDFWKIPPNHEKPIRTFFVRIARIIFASFRSFYQDECNIKASLLTFYTLVSIVPFLALVISIAQIFGFEEFLRAQILSTFSDQRDVISLAMNFAYALLTKLKGDVILGIGIVFVFFSIFVLLATIERLLNQIWRIKKRRSFYRRAINYMALLIICPIVFTTSSSLTIFISALLQKTASDYSIFQQISSFALSLIKLAPFALSCALFTFIYLFTPNSKIQFLPRIFAGILAGILYQVWQICYIELQVKITSYNAIYGSFAALPLFLIWMQVNFYLFLYGAEVAAHIEDEKFYRSWESKDQFTEAHSKHVALLILDQCMRAFQDGKPPLSILQIASNIGMPLFEARDIIHILVKEDILAEIDTAISYDEKCQLTMNPELITFKRIQDVMERHKSNMIPMRNSKTLEVILNCFKEFDNLTEHSQANLNLKQLLQQKG